MSLGDSRQPTLSEEIAALADGDSIEAELAEMKRAMAPNSSRETPAGAPDQG